MAPQLVRTTAAMGHAWPRGLGQGLINRAEELDAQQGTEQREEDERYAVANAF